MAFMSLEKKFFRKENKYYIILLFFSCLSNFCLFSLMSGHIIHCRYSTNEQSNIFWGPKYGFTASKAFYGKFSLILCWLSVCFFATALKIEYQEFLITLYRSIGNCKPMGYFSWFLMVFITLKLIVFFKFSEFSNFKVSVFFCLIVTKLYYELVKHHFSLVNYQLIVYF